MAKQDIIMQEEGNTTDRRMNQSWVSFQMENSAFKHLNEGDKAMFPIVE